MMPPEERAESGTVRAAPRGAGNTVATLLASFFGAGLSPFAPGTVGSAAAVAVAYVLEATVGLSYLGLALMILGAGVVNIALGPWIERRFAPTESKDGREPAKGPDPGLVVVDECAGQWIALLPAVGILDPVLAGVAFFSFRIFDVTKALGVSRLERLPGAWGILMDDVLAGVYAAIVVLGVRFVL